MPDIADLACRLGIQELALGLLRQALTHSSYANDHPGEEDNERLEFLGDAVLSLCCSRMLYHRFPFVNEGQLSRLRASLVCEQTLADIAQEIELSNYLRLGKGASSSGGHALPSIISGTVEALLGATYEGLGYDSAEELFSLLYTNILQGADADFPNSDAKTALQERAPESVEYRVVNEAGPPHDRWFTVEVLVKGAVRGKGEGRSKKKAEQDAASAALKSLLEK